MFLIWRCISLSLNGTYLCLHCLKEIYGLVQHYAHHIWHFWPMYEQHWRLPFASNLRKLYLLRFHHLVIFVTWNWAVKKFVFLFFWTTFNEIFCPYSFIIFSLAMWFLIVNQSHRMAQISFCLYLQHPGFLSLAVFFFWYNGGNLIIILFHLWTDKKKNGTWCTNISGDKSLSDTWFRRIRLTLRHCIVSPEIINLFFGGKNTLRDYSQSDYHLIYPSDIHRSYLIYFQVCNMLKILRH